MPYYNTPLRKEFTSEEHLGAKFWWHIYYYLYSQETVLAESHESRGCGPVIAKIPAGPREMVHTSFLNIITCLVDNLVGILNLLELIPWVTKAIQNHKDWISILVRRF